MTSNNGPPPDTAVSQPAPPGSAPPADERVRKVSGLSRLLSRPEVGAIIGAVLVWVFFAIVAYNNSFVSWATTASILNRAAPLGILAVVVALLMIGGEFDLSIGSILGFAGMTVMVLITPSMRRRIRLGRLAGNPACAGLRTGDRVLQRRPGDCDETAVVHHHAGDALHLPGIDDRDDPSADGSHAAGRLRRGVRGGARRQDLRLRLHGLRGEFPGLDPLVDRDGCARDVDPACAPSGATGSSAPAAMPTRLATSVFR